MSTERITYKQLIAFHIEKLRERSVSEGSIRNAESALHAFMKTARRSNSSTVGNEWEDEKVFSSYLSRCLCGRRESTKRSLQSLLRAWRESAIALLSGARPDDKRDFYDILREAIIQYQAKKNLSLSKLSQALLVSRMPLTNFIRGTAGLRVIRLPLPQLEEILELRKGVLVEARNRQVVPDTTAPEVSFRAQLPKLHATRYRFKRPPPLYRVHEEFEELRNFKTAEIVPPGMQRHDRWGTRPISDSDYRTPRWEEKLDENRVCPSGDVAWGLFSAFLGWATWPVENGGKAMDPEILSLAYLTDTELLREYLEFHKARNGGEFSVAAIRLLSNVAALLRPGTGFLRQKSVFATRLSQSIPQSKWDVWCSKARQEILGLIGALKQVTRKRRHPDEPINAILNRQHPLSAIDEMLDNMQRNIPQTALFRAVLERNILIIKLLSVVPLRVRNLVALTYQPSNTGHLRRVDGEWRLVIKGGEFKNFKHAARYDFKITLPRKLGVALTEYIEKWRPILVARSDDSDQGILFPQIDGKKYPSIHMSQVISGLSRKYCPDTPGFGPHAFRHIVATEYLKNNPNGYQVVAYILHDKLETVLREYGHVTTSDGFAHWTNYLEDSAFMSGGKDKEPRE